MSSSQETFISNEEKQREKLRRVINMYKNKNNEYESNSTENEDDSNKKSKFMSDSISGFINKLDLFTDEKQKSSFNKNLNEMLQESEAKKFLNNPFVSTLLNLGLPLIMAIKDKNNKKEGDSK